MGTQKNRLNETVLLSTHNISSVGSKKLFFLIFKFFRRDKKIEKLLLGVSYIAESQTGLYLKTSEFTGGVLNFQ